MLGPPGYWFGEFARRRWAVYGHTRRARGMPDRPTPARPRRLSRRRPPPALAAAALVLTSVGSAIGVEPGAPGAAPIIDPSPVVDPPPSADPAAAQEPAPAVDPEPDPTAAPSTSAAPAPVGRAAT